jgi:hypothetical protein
VETVNRKPVPVNSAPGRVNWELELCMIIKTGNILKFKFLLAFCYKNFHFLAPRFLEDREKGGNQFNPFIILLKSEGVEVNYPV